MSLDIQHQVFKFFREFCGQSNMLTIPVAMIDFTGDHESALLLSQILYWSGKTSNPDGWFYKSYKDWHQELRMTEYQVRRASNRFKAIGFLETVAAKVNGSPTLHYRINIEKFSEWILKKLQEPTRSDLSGHPKETSGTSYIDTLDYVQEITGSPQPLALPEPLSEVREEENTEASVTAEEPKGYVECDEDGIPSQPERKQRSQWPQRKKEPKKPGCAAEVRAMFAMGGRNAAAGAASAVGGWAVGTARELERSQQGAFTGQEYVDTWKRITGEAMLWDPAGNDRVARGKLERIHADANFSGNFEKLCLKVRDIRAAGKPGESSWLTFRYLLTMSVKTGTDNWWRLLNGEFDFLLTAEKAKPTAGKGRTAELAEEYRARAAAKKSGPAKEEV